jgi:flagellar hook-associated protein 2
VNSGVVKTSTLSSNREVQDWGHTIRQKAFAALSAATGTVRQLADLGIDFQGTSSQLLIRDPSKLDAALTNHPDDVQAFFNTANTGFAATMNKFLGTLMGSDGTGTDGALSMMKNTLTGNNASIDQQIAAIQRQLDSEKERLSIGFQAMQNAQQNAKTMSDALTNAFGSNSSK